jgi:hypothetical protein
MNKYKVRNCRKLSASNASRRLLQVLLIAGTWIFVGGRISGQPVLVSVKTDQHGIAISQNALGLSYETSLMMPDTNGVRYFRPDNLPLLQLFKTLGVKNLRIGGNSVDDPKIPLPSPEDVCSFFDFAKAAGVKVIYSVRLQDGDPQSAAQYAKLIQDHYADILECFAIGNEPGYYKDYTVYLPKWIALRDAIVAVYPEATFCGPDQNPDPVLIKKMVQDLGSSSGRLSQIVQHSYPFGCSYKNPQVAWKGGDASQLVAFDAAISRKKMLSPEAYKTYEKILQGMTEAVKGTQLSYRLTETNSYWFSGLQGASDSYASALWAADYLHWWVAKGATGLNFHNGDRTGGSVNLPCRYAAFVSMSKGYEIRPLSYGMKLFSLSGQGHSLSVSISSDSSQNVAAYAIIDSENTVTVTLINKNSDPASGTADVSIKPDQTLTNAPARAIFLTSKDDNIAAGPDDILLGGRSITEKGQWNGKWTKLAAMADKKTIKVALRPASAVVVKFKLR